MRMKMTDFIEKVGRSELFECPRSYLKGVEVTLLILGYNQDQIHRLKDGIENRWLKRPKRIN